METRYNDKAIGIWLLVVAFLVFLMVVVGGATRLTESGLSMVRWEPISGAIPPMNAAEWQAEFQSYQQFPEYIKVNKGMSLSEFKAIFWWEYSHRLIGRLIGLVFAFPLLFFMARRMVRPELKMPLFTLLSLGAVQGAMGWYMVTSGLVDNPAVSHFRLAAHLLLALVIFTGVLGLGLKLLRPKIAFTNEGLSPLEYKVKGLMRQKALAKLKTPLILFLGLVFMQFLFGAFVAGLDAGFIFNTWPLMDGEFIPKGAYEAPFLSTLLNDPMSVQLTHRLLAYGLLGYSFIFFIILNSSKTGYSDEVKKAVYVMIAILWGQAALGITTLLTNVQIAIGVSHQAMAVLVLASIIIVLNRVWREQA